jgi:benzoyl-CoA reductase/2-hydroxyglutaryl-CoA dehydratase subunit BcrC/BadD/HgdB
VDVPNVCTEETIHYVADQLKDLTCMVEEIMGAKMEEDHLREVIRSENRSLQMYHEHFRLLVGKFVPSIPGDEMNKIFPTHVLMGTPDAENYFKLLLEDTRAAAPSHGEKRILWAHTIPSSQGGIQQFLSFDDQRQLLACDINFDYLGEMDATQPYESMAKKLLLNLVNGSEKNRAKGLLRMARYLRANGVVYFCHWGCKQTLGGARLISEYLEKEGIPVLVLDGDSCDPKNVNEGQMNTRLQAFLEMLEAER